MTIPIAAQPPASDLPPDAGNPPPIDPPLTEASFDDSIPAPDYRLGDRRIPVRSRGLRNLLAVFGPGLITGASDDDPSGVGTYSTAGAATGYRYLWTALITYPMIAAIAASATASITALPDSMIDVSVLVRSHSLCRKKDDLVTREHSKPK